MMLSSGNPAYPQNATASGPQALQQALENEGLDYEPTRGKYGKPEDSFIVHIRDPQQVETAKSIAKRMGQESVVHSQGGKHQLVYVNGQNEGLATAPAEGYKIYQQEPEDDYTAIPGASGQPLGFFSYKLDFSKPLRPHGYVEAPQAAQAVLKAAVDAYAEALYDIRMRELKKADKGEISMSEESGSPAVPGANFRIPGHRKTEVAKYEVKEKGTAGHGGDGIHDDISAQQGGVRPKTPNSAITGGGSIKNPTTATAKNEDVGTREHIQRVHEREGKELGSIPMRRPDAPPRKESRAFVPSIAEERKANKTETPMKLHDLLKAQSSKKCPVCGSTRTPGQHCQVCEEREGYTSERAGKPSVEHTLFEESDPKVLHPSDAKKTERLDPIASHAQKKATGGNPMVVKGEGLPTGGPNPKAVQYATQPPKTEKAEFLSKPPVSEAQRAAMGAAAGGHSTLGIPKKVGKEFIEADKGGKLPDTKKATSEWGKDAQGYHSKPFPGEKPAAADQKAPGEESSKEKPMSDSKKYVVKNSVFKKEMKLGKQEFFIDLTNASDQAKRLKNVAPVKGAKDPFTSDPKDETTAAAERGTSSQPKKNAPKAGPDQKNDSAPIITEKVKPEPSKKNDLIEKEEFPATRRYSIKLGKVGAAMAAPQAPKAPGVGAPKLSGAKPPAMGAKPPAAAPGGMPMGKAFGDELRPQGRVAAVAPGTPPPAPAGAPMSAASIRGTPAYGMKNPGAAGIAQTRAMVGKPAAMPGVRSPAMLKNIRWDKMKKGFIPDPGYTHPPVKKGEVKGVPTSEGSGSPETSNVSMVKGSVKGIPESEGSGSPETSKITKGSIEGIPTSEGSGSPETSKVTKAEMCKMCKKSKHDGKCV